MKRPSVPRTGSAPAGAGVGVGSGVQRGERGWARRAGRAASRPGRSSGGSARAPPTPRRQAGRSGPGLPGRRRGRGPGRPRPRPRRRGPRRRARGSRAASRARWCEGRSCHRTVAHVTAPNPGTKVPPAKDIRPWARAVRWHPRWGRQGGACASRAQKRPHAEASADDPPARDRAAAQPRGRRLPRGHRRLRRRQHRPLRAGMARSVGRGRGRPVAPRPLLRRRMGRRSCGCSGLYRLRARWSWRTEWTDLLRAILLIAFLTFAFLFVVKLPNVSRLFLLWLFVAQAVVAVASRGLLRFLFARAREARAQHPVRPGRRRRPGGPRLRAPGSSATRTSACGWRASSRTRGRTTRARVPRPRPPTPATARRRPLPPGRWAGSARSRRSCARRSSTRSRSACRPSTGRSSSRSPACARRRGWSSAFPLVDGATAIPGGRLEDFEGIRLQSLVYGPDRTLGLIAKRLIDIAGGARRPRRPVPAPRRGRGLRRGSRRAARCFFRQVRVGVRGRPVPASTSSGRWYRDAEDRYEEVAALSETKGAAFKMTDDPRITRVGPGPAQDEHRRAPAVPRTCCAAR